MSFTLQEFQKRIPLANTPEQKIELIHQFAWSSDDLYPNDLFLKEHHELLNEAFELSIQTNNRKGIAYGYVNKAYFILDVNEESKKIELLKMGLAIFREMNDEEGIVKTLNMMSSTIWMLGKYDEAMEYGYNVLRYSEELNNPEYLGWSNFGLGIIHYDLKDYAASENYFKKAHSFFTKGKHTVHSISRCKGELGKIMIATKRFDEAMEYILSSLEGYRQVHNIIGESRGLNDLGVMLKIQGKYAEAETSLKASLKLREESKYSPGIITTSFELGGLYLKKKEYNTALGYLHYSLEIAETNKSRPKIFQIHETLSEVYKQTDELAKALEHKEKFFALKMEIAGEQAINKLQHLQMQFATEKSEKEMEIHRLKNVELKKAYEEIEEKNKNILDSINYAKRIQQAILPSNEEIKTILPDSFVLYKPKDIVSGDFYWVAKKENKIVVAAVDCTGHGIPGAFMSMIGNTLLNAIVNEKNITAPHEILFHLREGIIKSLKQTGIEGENQDGMDISIYSLNNLKLEYSGANNPLWIFNNNQIKEIKADKQPIGIFYGTPKPFTNHSVEIEKGDSIYIFTDGYADQFNEKAEKLKKSGFKEFLFTIQQQSMSEQKLALNDFIEKWRGAHEQVDDILVMGVKA
jgi:serine phosphatase RsbU (regulator of sigma subunit)